ncbi:uncharacterized protein N7459_002937 [Penicillium hispanicum]|uniref:uncharacterized protein n=1 Tax=Penicillium hispanicum TaxID=1080232 RepID=UPI002542352E|nr:uncharacterized protein N7459_002937 [Penicillium hispanicum]KAJ5587172.1 hypothetical protein N7459_002937 [Penicillium hispanicum]
MTDKLVQIKDTRTNELFTQECRILVSAVGGLVDPRPFSVPGIESFTGQIVHTSRWDTDIDLYNKNAAVIGNGVDGAEQAMQNLREDKNRYRAVLSNETKQMGKL